MFASASSMRHALRGLGAGLGFGGGAGWSAGVMGGQSRRPEQGLLSWIKETGALDGGGRAAADHWEGGCVEGSCVIELRWQARKRNDPNASGALGSKPKDAQCAKPDTSKLK